MKLDLDDLADLVELLRSRTTGPVSIRAGKYDADEAEDLVDAGDKDLESIELTTVSPLVQVTIAPYRASAWSQTEDPETIRLLDDIAEQVNAHRLPLKLMFPAVVLANYVVLIFAGVMFARTLYDEGSTTGGHWALVGTALLIAAMALYMPRSWRRTGAVQIVALRRRDWRSGRSDFRRKTATALIGAVVGAVVGAALAWYLKG